MLNENFVIVGAILNLIGSLNYLVATIKGGVKPDRVTWLLWSVIPFIAFTAQIKQGVGLQSLMTFMTGFTPLMIFLASFANKKSFWRLGRLDIICGTLSIAGILLWYITKTGNTAIIFSIIADCLAAIPTIIKSYHAPETEDYKIYLLGSLAAAITLLTIKTWSFAYFGWPVYILIVTLLLTVLIRFKLGRLSSSW
ncbi:TPA: hypothetical protein DD690_02485 [Candidatus Daviesbacteria bacterium]|uniref:Uncharacterized protein n=1 Tax=Candidatus Daviesbacteria bacterium GW2011_GWF2_38_6 TaxID=1618432 RepID=A0A0G0MYT3_9BACT|nr:MAG: hypothetical protein US99_C0011G0009 [Candidatus Daviesbacteria bacterium GW2011_GWF2_38_6]OGE26679.1 MAG: hypothetical protein A3D02_02130 [Candidatus Daviesbacteria bacterium RIFCSPHIGHO2_02_FULL_39_41]OGE45174.1 MAG: hypothetical protein A3E67_03145 [Candidatus Daviesbacteria bacterium RIFCSPHIGHO2_12_FULL_38_25]OGE68366.1 MAG: hypothetical protein A3H81_02420 [Candidatus Daviesbacteria bacterium RIFCSPLOWO2_02_FULL_38_18]OGE72163.1 MAG: hypothetical protein A3H18_01575 [Candidatus D